MCQLLIAVSSPSYAGPRWAKIPVVRWFLFGMSQAALHSGYLHDC